MGLIKHSQTIQSNKFAISLQYLKKEVRNGGHFRQADKPQSIYKLILSFFMEMARHVQNTQNRKLAIFLQYIAIRIAATALCSVVIQNIQIFYGVPVLVVVTWFSEVFHKFCIYFIHLITWGELLLDILNIFFFQMLYGYLVIFLINF